VRIDGQEHKDVAWSYPDPITESAAIAGHYAFYNERVELFVDGEKQERPRTRWSMTES
jgi:uncharacterized protein (DUF427 family)